MKHPPFITQTEALILSCRNTPSSFRPDGVGTVLAEEKERFQHIKERLRVLLEHQITNFMYCFPFGRPEGALKATLSLLERVLMKDIVTPVPPEEVRGMIKKCLENAALLNYTRLSAETRIEGGESTLQGVADPKAWLRSDPEPHILARSRSRSQEQQQQ
ncbi:calcium-dependent secretion activator 1-like [Scylla paramamosain]|uniref:calcium-dependent secretion activator 1-like n=1 Tax=Scylla paramamosain TaxID=85552 RepID=UPI003082F721